jgi:hypothetical protein
VPTNHFPTEREAKEFLVAKIVEEAQREGISLSEIERKMLYFSETGWTLPNIMDVNDEFDQNYDQNEYEKKVTRLARNLTKRLRQDNRDEYGSWADAVRTLSKGDHYILVMIGHPGISTGSPRRPGDLLRLWITGLILVVLALCWVFGGAYLLDKYKIGPSDFDDRKEFLAWAAPIAALIVYGLLWTFLGRARTNRTFGKITDFVFGIPKSKE